jgi:hypothetical protein
MLFDNHDGGGQGLGDGVGKHPWGTHQDLGELLVAGVLFQTCQSNEPGKPPQLPDSLITAHYFEAHMPRTVS